MPTSLLCSDDNDGKGLDSKGTIKGTSSCVLHQKGPPRGAFIMFSPLKGPEDLHHVASTRRDPGAPRRAPSRAQAPRPSPPAGGRPLGAAHPFVQPVRVLGAVGQLLRERVAAGVAQRRVLPALQAGLSQQHGPHLAHRRAPLLLPEEHKAVTLRGAPRDPRGAAPGGAHFLVLWVKRSVSLSRARAYSASMSPRRRRNSERSESCCCFTSTWESRILIWSVSCVRRSDRRGERGQRAGESVLTPGGRKLRLRHEELIM
ncbi:hypothetical protein EYF80_064152 [Liparis tanakae]|uniref:Uncharacterized protein n=1 Tax=Liparis tanakae TaxID=230148 RepID=A0A4Z2EA46_9TELE|nr:hypothetical protein EYF80_064152 [Liparis tanakae]